MPNTLLIVESPAKCKKIEEYLGKNYSCIASFGHIRELSGMNSIDIEDNFKLTYSILSDKKKQVANILNAIKKADNVMLATDDDREGEAIAWHVCHVAKLPTTTPRIVFHEITKPALLKAVNNPKKINLSLVHAQQARQVLDMLVGYKISPILWSKIAKKTNKGLSAGRCQTPALKIVYENELEIKKDTATKVYKTTGYFTSKHIPFILQHEYKLSNEIKKFLEKSITYNHIYNCSDPRTLIKPPPLPFTTCSLQQAASNSLQYSPAETMKICQSLYEGGYITYMRTDSCKYSIDFITSVVSYIKQEYGEQYIHQNIDNISIGGKKNKNAQEAHEAIRITNLVNVKLDKLDNKEKRMYLFIRQRTLESCMNSATYSAITASITSPDVGNAVYKYTSETPIDLGWQKANASAEVNNEYSFLKNIKQNSKIQYSKITSIIKLKNSPLHYSEASLVKQLEKKGIGRPSTFSSLVSKIQERGYVKKQNITGTDIKCCDFELEKERITQTDTLRKFGNEKNKLVLQPVGRLVIEYLIKEFDKLFDYEYTQHMENTLDIVASGKKDWRDMCLLCLGEINDLIDKAGVIEKQGIYIDEEHTYIIGKYGPVIKHTSKQNKVSFKPVKDTIDICKLRNNEYTLDDLLKSNNINKPVSRSLGNYKNSPVILHHGRYGYYIEWNSQKKSVSINKNPIELDDVIPFLTSAAERSIIRAINEDMSIRSGKYGDYIFYKKKTWKKPRFIKLIDFIKKYGENSYKTCDISLVLEWLSENYSI